MLGAHLVRDVLRVDGDGDVGGVGGRGARKEHGERVHESPQMCPGRQVPCFRSTTEAKERHPATITALSWRFSRPFGTSWGQLRVASFDSM